MIFTGRIHKFGDHVDTDVIIPATLLSNTDPRILGRGAFSEVFPGFADRVKPGDLIFAGENFGCGSSREHAPIAMGAAGCEAVIADSFARIFFRNCVATGELYPYDATSRLCDVLKTGDVGTLDLDANTLTVNGQTHALKPLGEAKPVIDAGGVFNFARKSGMLPA